MKASAIVYEYICKLLGAEVIFALAKRVCSQVVLFFFFLQMQSQGLCQVKYIKEIAIFESQMKTQSKYKNISISEGN